MEFVEIFSKMNWVPACLFTVGLIFTIVEVLLPGFGFFGITGTISIVVGVIVRSVQGLNTAQVFTLVLIILGLYMLGGLFIVFNANKGILTKTGVFEKSSSLSADYNKTDEHLKELLGQVGKAVCDLKLGGQAKIKGKLYDVQAVGGYITRGARIKVVEIKDNTILVKKWFE